MLKTLKNFFKKNPNDSATPAVRVVLEKHKLCELFRYFPVGRKVDYYPEYREEITLDTIIIAYQINNKVVYATSEISCSADNKSIALNGTTIDEINTFAFLIPTTSRGETTLDYESKELLGQNGGFTRGNSITLTGASQDGQIPVIDTVVRRYARLKEGHFHNTQVVVLNVDPALLTLKDQRSQARLSAQISAQIQTKLYVEPNPCTIIDFSGQRIKVECNAHEIIPMSCDSGERVTLTFELPNSPAASVLRGTIEKVDNASLIIELDEILIGEIFEQLKPIDLIEIKTKLLQHSAESRVTAENLLKQIFTRDASI